jgi:hypothetical protein
VSFLGLVPEIHFFEPAFVLGDFVISVIPYIHVIRGQKIPANGTDELRQIRLSLKNPRHPWMKGSPVASMPSSAIGAVARLTNPLSFQSAARRRA